MKTLAQRSPQPLGMPRPNILVVEDDEPLASLLRYNFEADGFDVTHATRSEHANLLISENMPDLVILDWTLPGSSGLELCRALRARDRTGALPIIMLTARGQESDKIRALGTGADDYISKPFSVAELMARVRALLRRARPERIASKLIQGEIELDRETHRVTRVGRAVRIGPTEFRLLEFLMERSGRVFSRSQLLDGIWGITSDIDERTVDVHIGRLRRALIVGNQRDPIRTVRGAGYAFDDTFARS